MKKLILALVFFISYLGFSQDLNWQTDFDTAKLIAQQENKSILMYFTGSDWCAPCKQLKADFFHSERFIKESDKLILLMVDLPFRQDIITDEQRKKNKELIKKYNRDESFPLLIALSNNGRELNRISAYGSLRDTTLHFNFLNSFIY